MLRLLAMSLLAAGPLAYAQHDAFSVVDESSKPVANATILLGYDVGNPFPPDFTPVQIVRRYAKRIPAFHLRDSIAGKEVLFGAGDFDFAALGRTLAEFEWAGWLIVEVNRNPQIPSRKLVETARDYVRKQMKI